MITFEAKIREQIVRMNSDLPLKNAAGAIMKVLTQISHQTNIFNNRFVLCFGWAYFYLIQKEDGEGVTYWSVETGDYKRNPKVNRTDNVTSSLVVQNMQMEAIQVSKSKPEPCTCHDTILVLKEAMAAEDVYLNRTAAAKDGDSGWYFGMTDDPNEDNHALDDYLKLPTYKLMDFCPEALRVLQMPVGTVAVIQNKELTALVDANDKPLRFTTEAERRKMGEKQRAEFEKMVAEARAKAEAEKAAASAEKKTEDKAD